MFVERAFKTFICPVWNLKKAVDYILGERRGDIKQLLGRPQTHPNGQNSQSVSSEPSVPRQPPEGVGVPSALESPTLGFEHSSDQGARVGGKRSDGWMRDGEGGCSQGVISRIQGNQREDQRGKKGRREGKF